MDNLMGYLTVFYQLRPLFSVERKIHRSFITFCGRQWMTYYPVTLLGLSTASSSFNRNLQGTGHLKDPGLLWWILKVVIASVWTGFIRLPSAIIHDLVRMVTNCRFSRQAKYTVTNWTTISFSVKICIMELVLFHLLQCPILESLC